MQASRLPIWRLVALSWSDVWRALRAMPLLFGCAVLILFAVRVAETVLPKWLWDGAIVGTLASVAENAIQYFCLTPVMMAIHRFVIRGDVTRSYDVDLSDPNFLLFFAWTMAISILFSAVLAINEAWSAYARAGGAMPLVTLAIFVVALLAATWLSLRLIVLFPAIAVGAAGAKAANAFADTKGYDLRLAAIFLLAFIPFFAVTILVVMALGRGAMAHGSTLSVVSRFFSAIFATIAEALGVVVASHVYLAIGRKLR